MAEDKLQQQNEEILATGDAPDRRMEACTDELRTSNDQLRPQITELEHAEMAVEERLQFETLLSQLSTRFLNLPPGEVDRQIEHGLQRLAQFLEVDRSTLFEFSQEKTHLRSAKQKELAQTLSALAVRVRKEAGCVSSAFYRQVENENALCVIEEWATQADLDAHLGSDNFRVLRGAVKLLNGPSQMRFHSVTQTLGEEAVAAARERRAGGR